MKRIIIAAAALAAFCLAPCAAKPGTLNITLSQGATWAIQCTVKDSTGTVVNLGSYTGAAQIRATPSSSVILATITVTFVDRANGIFSLSLTSTQTAALPLTTGAQWDLFLLDGSSRPYRILMGSVAILPRVTR